MRFRVQIESWQLHFPLLDIEGDWFIIRKQHLLLPFPSATLFYQNCHAPRLMKKKGWKGRWSGWEMFAWAYVLLLTYIIKTLVQKLLEAPFVAIQSCSSRSCWNNSRFSREKKGGSCRRLLPSDVFELRFFICLRITSHRNARRWRRFSSL